MHEESALRVFGSFFFVVQNKRDYIVLCRLC